MLQFRLNLNWLVFHRVSDSLYIYIYIDKQASYFDHFRCKKLCTGNRKNMGRNAIVLYLMKQNLEKALPGFVGRGSFLYKRKVIINIVGIYSIIISHCLLEKDA